MYQNIYWDDQDGPYCSWVSWMFFVNKLCFEAPLGFIWMPLIQLDWCTSCASKHQHICMTLDASGCLRCLLMYKLSLDAPRDSYGWSRWPLMELDVLVYLCTSCALMHQHIFMDAEDDPQCTWMSWMSINVAWYLICLSKLLMTLDAAGCLDAQVVTSCTYGYGCSRWQSMQLDVLDVYQCTSCPLMHQHKLWMLKMILYAAGSLRYLLMHKLCLEAPTHIMDDQDDLPCSLMSWMSVDAQLLSWCTKRLIWMIKVTLDASGYLGCLLMYKVCLDAPRDSYGCSRWPLMKLDVSNVGGGDNYTIFKFWPKSLGNGSLPY